MQEGQVAILFADVSGFTKLEGAEVSNFITHVMGTLAKTVEKHQPIIKNTWGDAIFLVFPVALDAARCALEIRDEIRNENWSRKGIHRKIEMRIALHNAHATIANDPITKKNNAYGNHINKAARLEPVVIPGEVFATEEFKQALDTHGSEIFAWDEVGKMDLAKGWGESQVYRLRRPSETILDKQNLIKPLQLSIGQLMPNAQALLSGNGSVESEASGMIKYIDEVLIGNGVIRRNWTMYAAYDVTELAKGVITENLQWSYELINLRNVLIRHKVGLITAPDLESGGGLISFHRINEDGSETNLLPPTPQKTTTPMFTNDMREVGLEPLCKYKLELRYKQEWSVNRDRPMIHNSWAPRETSFLNRLEIDASIKDDKVGVLFGNNEVKCVFHSGSRYQFNIPSPILRDQAIEILLEFNPLANSSVLRKKKASK